MERDATMLNQNSAIKGYSKSERKERQKTNTVYRQLLNRGFTHEQLWRAFKNQGSLPVCQIGLGWYEDDFGSDPVIGIIYNGDYRYEEESGIRKIAEFLNMGENQNQIAYTRVMTHDGHEYTQYCLESEDPFFSDSWDMIYQKALERHLSPYNDMGDIWQMDVKAMREELKGKVIPLPRRRPDVEKAYAENVLGKVIKKYESIGEFNDGKVLVMMTQEPVLSATLGILFEDTVKANQLVHGSDSNPFSRGSFFYDYRDVSVEQHNENVAAQR